MSFVGKAPLNMIVNPVYPVIHKKQQEEQFPSFKEKIGEEVMKQTYISPIGILKQERNYGELHSPQLNSSYKSYVDPIINTEVRLNSDRPVQFQRETFIQGRINPEDYLHFSDRINSSSEFLSLTKSKDVNYSSVSSGIANRDNIPIENRIDYFRFIDTLPDIVNYAGKEDSFRESIKPNFHEPIVNRNQYSLFSGLSHPSESLFYKDFDNLTLEQKQQQYSLNAGKQTIFFDSPKFDLNNFHEKNHNPYSLFIPGSYLVKAIEISPNEFSVPFLSEHTNIPLFSGNNAEGKAIIENSQNSIFPKFTEPRNFSLSSGLHANMNDQNQPDRNQVQFSEKQVIPQYSNLLTTTRTQNSEIKNPKLNDRNLAQSIVVPREYRFQDYEVNKKLIDQQKQTKKYNAQNSISSVNYIPTPGLLQAPIIQRK